MEKHAYRETILYLPRESVCGAGEGEASGLRLLLKRVEEQDVAP